MAARRVGGPVLGKAEARSRAIRSSFRRLGHPELDDYARARLDPFYGIAIVEDDPYAPDASHVGFDDDGPPADCPYRTGKRVPRRCNRPNGHEGTHDFVLVTRPEPIAPAVPEPVAAPAPVLAAEPDPAARPTCPRCGQRFRLSGRGYAWHIDNRPNCAAARPSIAA